MTKEIKQYNIIISVMEAEIIELEEQIRNLLELKSCDFSMQELVEAHSQMYRHL